MISVGPYVLKIRALVIFFRFSSSFGEYFSPPHMIILHFESTALNASSSIYCSMRDGVAFITSPPVRSNSAQSLIGSLVSSSSASTSVRPLHSDAAVSLSDISKDTVVTET